jgi:acyl-CoA dehydrogenase
MQSSMSQPGSADGSGGAAAQPVAVLDPMVGEAADRLFGTLAPAAHAAAARGEPPDDLIEAIRQSGFADALSSLDARDDWPAAAAILRAQGRHAVPVDLADELLARAVAAEPEGEGTAHPRIVAADLGRASDARRLRALALMRCLQITGAMEAALALSIRYVSDRKQFGRTLASNQAIQHALAIATEEAALATVAADIALSAVIAEGLDAPRVGAMIDAAVVVTGESVSRVHEVVHQVHGAIGFTRDYPLHRFTTSMVRWRDELGSELASAERLGDAVMRAGGLWQAVTDLATPAAAR